MNENDHVQQLEQVVSQIIREIKLPLSSEEIADIALQKGFLEPYFFQKYYSYSRKKAVANVARRLRFAGKISQCYIKGEKQPISLWSCNETKAYIPIPAGSWA